MPTASRLRAPPHRTEAGETYNPSLIGLMSDPSRPLPAASTVPPPDQDATIESLLVAGLDLYFAGEYERAIHAWTRVLFLDRGHARARAYIDRARKVLAERQRQGDLLLHRAIDAFDRGDLAQARALLDQAVAGGAQDTQALALRDRLNRLQALPTSGDAHGTPNDAPSLAAVGRVARPGRRAVWPMVGIGAVAVVLAAGWPSVVEWAASERTRPVPVASAPAMPALPVPWPSDLLLERAKGLFERGHLHEAGVLLAGIRLDDPRRADADRLLADIQRELLAGAVPARPGRALADTAAGPAR